jgi:hypothetical protein
MTVNLTETPKQEVGFFDDIVTAKGPVVNVLAYGADPTGATDSTAAIQAALDIGGEVFLPAGSYLCSSAAVNFSTSKSTILCGAGMGRTTIYFTHASASVNGVNMYRPANNIYMCLRDMTISGRTLAGIATALGHGVFLDSTTSGTMMYVSNVHVTGFTNPGKAGIYTTNLYNSHFDNTCVTGCYYGAYLDTNTNANYWTAINYNGNVCNLYLAAECVDNIFVGGQIGNSPYNIKCYGRQNIFNIYAENGGTTVLGVTNPRGPTVIFYAGSQNNDMMGPHTGSEEKYQDLGIDNVLPTASTPYPSRGGAMELASLDGSGGATLTNLFYDSSFKTGDLAGAGSGDFPCSQGLTGGLHDDTCLIMAHSGATGGTYIVTMDQTFSGLTGESWCCTFWIKASRDMIDTESLRLFWWNGSSAINTVWITGLPSGVWRPYCLLMDQPLAENKTLTLKWQYNNTAPATAITFTVDDMGVQKFSSGGPVGISYVQNDSTVAARTLSGAGWYTPKLTADAATVGGAGVLVSGGALGTPASGNLANCTFPTLNQNTSGTAGNLSGTPALPNGTTATTQGAGDGSTKLATTAYVDTGLGTKQATLTNSAGLAGALSDETGTGYAVFSDSPTITTTLAITKASGSLYLTLTNAAASTAGTKYINSSQSWFEGNCYQGTNEWEVVDLTDSTKPSRISISPTTGAFNWIGNNGAKLSEVKYTEEVTIAAGASTVNTSTISLPAGMTVDAVVYRVTQAPGGGPTNFNLGLTGEAAPGDSLADNIAVTVNGTGDAFLNGDGTYTVPFRSGTTALTLTATVTDGSDNPVNVTGASFKLRLVVFGRTRTKPTS